MNTDDATVRAAFFVLGVPVAVGLLTSSFGIGVLTLVASAFVYYSWLNSDKYGPENPSGSGDHGGDGNERLNR